MIKMIATSFADLVGRASILHLFLHRRRIRKYEEEDYHSHFEICTALDKYGSSK
jgi:hypothetical protein